MTAEKATEVVDETQKQKIEECCEILVAAGYHRARLTDLESFERIIGGLVWCITKCNQSVDVDVLYDEDKTIGNKISNTEIIVELLIKLKSPISIQPHQIQGLDMSALLPLVQWLVKKVLEREEFEDNHKYFCEWFSNLEEIDRQDDFRIHRQEFAKRFRGLTAEIEVDPVLRTKKRPSGATILDLTKDARYTLAEYFKQGRLKKEGSSKVEEEAAEDEESLEDSLARSKVSASTARQLMEDAIKEIYKHETEEDARKRRELERDIEEMKINQTLLEIQNTIEEDAINYANEKSLNDSKVVYWNLIIDRSDKDDRDDVDRMTALITEYTQARTKAKILRQHTMKELEKVETQIRAARLNLDQETGLPGKYDVKLRESIDEMEKQRIEKANNVKNVAELQRKLDVSLSATVQTQYRKRQIEMGKNMEFLNSGMKNIVLDHNSAVDILQFTTKLNAFNNLVEEACLKNDVKEEYKNAFNAYMNDVRTQVDEYHWKAKVAQEKMLEERKRSHELISSIKVKHRKMVEKALNLEKLLASNGNLFKFLRALRESVATNQSLKEA